MDCVLIVIKNDVFRKNTKAKRYMDIDMLDFPKLMLRIQKKLLDFDYIWNL